MKKVLIVANLYDASPRIPGISKYLPQFGWEPVILTVPLKDDPRNLLSFPTDFRKNTRIIETENYEDIFYFIRKLLASLGFKKEKSIVGQAKDMAGIKGKKSFVDWLFLKYLEIFAYPDEKKGWIAIAGKRGKELLKNEKFDAILSSSPTPSSHVIAKRFKEFSNTRWVVDMRDPWSLNHNYHYGKIRKFFDSRLDKKTIEKSDSIVIVSDFLRNELKKYYVREDIFTITNGFDPERMNKNPGQGVSSKFTIVYTGQVYLGKQDPMIFFKALGNLVTEGKIDKRDLEVKFYGADYEWLKNDIVKYNLSDIFKYYLRIPQAKVIEKQREAQLLLLFVWEDRSVVPGHTSKIFEYLAAQRPIIATGGYGQENNEVAVLLKETGSGVYAITVEDVKDNLLKFYTEYKKNKVVSYSGKMEEIKKYSYIALAEKFAIVLNKISK